MRVSGEMISSTAEGLKHGQMVLATKETMSMERSMGMANLPGLMEAPTMVNLSIITLRVKEHINGQTAEFIQASGRITRWRAVEFSNGLTTEDMKESISMIKKKAMEFFTGQMAESTMANGEMGNKMVLAFTLQLQGKPSKVNGKMERE